MGEIFDKTSAGISPVITDRNKIKEINNIKNTGSLNILRVRDSSTN
jgi:hypothetical protein